MVYEEDVIATQAQIRLLEHTTIYTIQRLSTPTLVVTLTTNVMHTNGRPPLVTTSANTSGVHLLHRMNPHNSIVSQSLALTD